MMLLCFRTRRGAPADHHFDSHRTTAGFAAAAPRSELNELNGRRGRSELCCAMQTTHVLYAELKGASRSSRCDQEVHLSALMACGRRWSCVHAIFRWLVCAMASADFHVWWLYPCLLEEMRTARCGSLDGAAALWRALASRMA